jgi:hypothetical protein
MARSKVIEYRTTVTPMTRAKSDLCPYASRRKDIAMTRTGSWKEA